MGRREENVKIFEDTVELTESSKPLLMSIMNTWNSQQFIPVGAEITIPETHQDQEARIIVSSKRTLEAASAYEGKNVCILNFASATNAGGGVTNGSSAQEESICRCSTLYFCLTQEGMESCFYEPHRAAGNPLYNDDMIYSPGVTVFKSDTDHPERLPEDKWYQVNVITCAAPNLRRRPSNAMNPNAGTHVASISEGDLEKLLETRIRRIFAVAFEKGNEVLILGAFGCGAFCNPPEVVARVFRRITAEYRHCFETIEYAVYHTEREMANYQAFRRAFRNEVAE